MYIQKIQSILRCRCGHNGHRPIECLRYAVHYQGNICALVTLPAVRDRRKIGRICFCEYAVETNCRKNGCKTRILERYYSVDAEKMIAVAAYALHIVDSAAEAVEYGTGGRICFHNFQHPIKAFTAMYQQWQTKFA